MFVFVCNLLALLVAAGPATAWKTRSQYFNRKYNWLLWLKLLCLIHAYTINAAAAARRTYNAIAIAWRWVEHLFIAILFAARCTHKSFRFCIVMVMKLSSGLAMTSRAHDNFFFFCCNFSIFVFIGCTWAVRCNLSARWNSIEIENVIFEYEFRAANWKKCIRSIGTHFVDRYVNRGVRVCHGSECKLPDLRAMRIWCCASLLPLPAAYLQRLERMRALHNRLQFAHGEERTVSSERSPPHAYTRVRMGKMHFSYSCSR